MNKKRLDRKHADRQRQQALEDTLVAGVRELRPLSPEEMELVTAGLASVGTAG